MLATATAVGDSTNTAYLIIGIIVGLIGITGYLRTALRNEVRTIIKEVTPNGGNTNSLGDTAKRTETKVAKHGKDIKELRKQMRIVMAALSTANGTTIGTLAGHAEERRLEAIKREGTK